MAYRYYRRRWRRYFFRRRRYWRKNKRVDRPTTYATRQKLNFVYPITVMQGSVYVNMTINMNEILARTTGWQQFAEIYSAFRIYFISMELYISMPSNTQNNRQQIVFAFYPTIQDADRTVAQIMSTNNHGFATYGVRQARRLLWRANSSHSTILGYGSPIALSNLNDIMGSVNIKNSIEAYFTQAADRNINIGMINMNIYIEFYNNLI